MKDVGNWLAIDDSLNLMKDKADRTIIARDCITFTADGVSTKLFTVELKGMFAETPYSKPVKSSLDAVVLFDSKYLSEYIETGTIVPSEASAWEEFKDFLKTQ
jgi:hypothetical protein